MEINYFLNLYDDKYFIHNSKNIMMSSILKTLVDLSAEDFNEGLHFVSM